MYECMNVITCDYCHQFVVTMSNCSPHTYDFKTHGLRFCHVQCSVCGHSNFYSWTWFTDMAIKTCYLAKMFHRGAFLAHLSFCFLLPVCQYKTWQFFPAKLFRPAIGFWCCSPEEQRIFKLSLTSTFIESGENIFKPPTTVRCELWTKHTNSIEVWEW